MTDSVLTAIALIPIVVLVVLLFGFGRPVTKALPVVWVLTVLLGGLVWQTPWIRIAAVSVRAILIALDILLIIFGALVLLYTLRGGGALRRIMHSFAGVSGDRRVQAILIAWLLGAILEGSAGFGVPAVLLAPLLAGMGFPPVAAVMVTLVGNMTPVSFGPVGVPTVLGLGSALDQPAIIDVVSHAGKTLPGFVREVGVATAAFHSVMALVLPLVCVAMMTRQFGERRSALEGLAMWPYAILAGFVFVVPYLSAAVFLGPELPSLIGGLIGLAILVPLTRARFLTPRTNWDFPPGSGSEGWSSEAQGSDGDREDFPGVLRSWLPYGLAATILVITRLEALPFRALLSGTSIRIPALFGTDVVARLDILRNPGVFPLLVIALVSIPLFRIDRSEVRTAWTEAIRTMVAPAITLVCTVGMVEVMQAGHSGHGWDSMPAVMARTAASSVGVAWPMIAPFVGAFGTFLSGSNTVSNLLFGPVQFWVADGLGISRTVLVSLQNVGGSFGVVICLFKVSAACSAVGLAGSEGRVVRRMWFPLLLYGLVTGLAGLLVVNWLFPWIF